MTELTAEAQAVVDLAEYVAGEEFQNCLAALQAFYTDLPECPARHHVWGSTSCMVNLAGRVADEEALFNPPVVEPIDGPVPPEE